MKSTIKWAAAKAAHEANRAWCMAHGDQSQAHWEDAQSWQRESALDGVDGVAAGNGPRESHESWMKNKADQGWKFGDVKDQDAKTHPCMVPYEELPAEQRAKDAIFVSVVKAFLEADSE